MLSSYGVKTAFDFINLPDNWVKKQMSIVGLKLKRDLEGVETLNLDKYSKKQSIATTRTFDKMYDDFDQISERVSTFAVSCSEKLRKQNSCCKTIMVFVHTNNFRKDLDQYSRNIVINLPYATNSSIDIVKYSVFGLKSIFKQGFQYKKAGVIVMDIVPETPKQLTLFTNENPKHKKIFEVVDNINDVIGQKKIKLACQALDRTWKMNQERLSPRFTTNINEIINIKT